MRQKSYFFTDPALLGPQAAASAFGPQPPTGDKDIFRSQISTLQQRLRLRLPFVMDLSRRNSPTMERSRSSSNQASNRHSIFPSSAIFCTKALIRRAFWRLTDVSTRHWQQQTHLSPRSKKHGNFLTTIMALQHQAANALGCTSILVIALPTIRLSRDYFIKEIQMFNCHMLKVVGNSPSSSRLELAWRYRLNV